MVAAVLVALLLLLPAAGLAQVQIHEDIIFIGSNYVLTSGLALPVYARGTGLNNSANRVVSLGRLQAVNGTGRGLVLTTFGAGGQGISSTIFDTFGSTAASDSLAAAMTSMGNDQIGILTSYDAFEAGLTADLRAAAYQMGLYRLATIPIKPWRHPYAAIFYGSGPTTPSRQAIEILQPNAPDAPHAILATWLIEDGFAGQGVAAPASRTATSCRNDNQDVVFVDCLNGTVTDNRTGLVWLKDASCTLLGQRWWDAAMLGVMALADGTCGLTDGSSPGDWRLATNAEWSEMVSDVPFLCQPRIWNDAGTDCWGVGVSSFADVQNFNYWSANEDSPSRAWAMNLNGGDLGDGPKDSDRFVWPVRAAQ